MKAHFVLDKGINHMYTRQVRCAGIEEVGGRKMWDKLGSMKIAKMPQHSIMFMIIQAHRAPQGPVTAEGRERIGAAHLRHSFYAKA
jgi:hypothetical protein